MKMQELADTIGTSKPTLYRRIKAAGLDLDKMRDEHGDLLPEYISGVSALFDDIKPDAVQTSNETPSEDVSRPEVDSSTLELRLKLDAALQRIADLEESLAAARADADAWRRRSEADAARLDRLLPSGTAAEHGHPWWMFWK